MQIRPAVANDQAVIRQIIRDAHINPMGLDWRRFVVAVEGDDVIGTGQIKQHGDASRELASIAVVPAHRQQGVASAIIHHLLAHETGPLYLLCRASLEPFYARFGFRRVGPEEMSPYFSRMIRLAGVFGKMSRQTVQVIVMKR